VDELKEKKVNFCMVFIDLDKSYDKSSKSGIHIRKGVPRLYVKVIVDVYEREGATTRMKSVW